MASWSTSALAWLAAFSTWLATVIAASIVDTSSARCMTQRPVSSTAAWRVLVGQTANRWRTASVARARQVSNAAWLMDLGVMAGPPTSHLDTIRSLTPRWAANSRTLRRIACRSARTSAPVHRKIGATIRRRPGLGGMDRDVVPHGTAAGLTSTASVSAGPIGTQLSVHTAAITSSLSLPASPFGLRQPPRPRPVAARSYDPHHPPRRLHSVTRHQPAKPGEVHAPRSLRQTSRTLRPPRHN